MKRFVLFLFICSFALFADICAFATTYYLSPSGNNSGTGLSEGSAWKTFAYAFSHMIGGDELILLNGTYSMATGTGFITYNTNDVGDGNCDQPPNGTAIGSETYIHAKNKGSVAVIGATSGDFPHALFLGRKVTKAMYIKVEGIKFVGGGALYNADYCYIKDCGFVHTSTNNVGAFGIGAGDHTNGCRFNLIEDCWMWASNSRLIASNYRADCNVWRRIVVRGNGGSQSYMTGSGNPNVGFTVYESTGVSVQNMIIIDRVLNGGYPYADFASAMNTEGYHQHDNEWLGCISLNSEDTGYSLEAQNPPETNTLRLSNCIAWGSARSGINMGGAADNPIFANLTVGDNVSVGIRLWNSHGTVTGGSITNAISYNSGTYGFTTLVAPTYCNVYGSGTAAYNNSGQSCTAGARTTDPTNDGSPASLKYLVRIEDGSALKGTGAGGADYGANVIYRYGADGTRYGEPGYNTLTTNKLWPWPNEARIKVDMAADGARGFCTGNSIDGTPQTLTKYIWEYLGNQIPSSVYGITTTTLKGSLTLSGQGTLK